MIDGKRVLAIVPARGGSKGIPKKNIIDVNGKPLIAYTLEEAKKSKYLDRIIVSTDDPEIKEVSDRYGDFVPFMRPTELATDEAKSIDVVTNLLQTFKNYELIILLQPTSPLRTVDHIDDALELYIKSGKPSLVSLTPSSKHPNWMFYIDNNNNMSSVTGHELAHQRQSLKAVFVLNGAIYIATRDFIIQKNLLFDQSSVPYIMTNEVSLDIDNQYDLRVLSERLQS